MRPRDEGQRAGERADIAVQAGPSGTRRGASDKSASAMATIRPANNAADGTPSLVSGTVAAIVAAASSNHLPIPTATITSITL
jgi:hypothetical protein